MPVIEIHGKPVHVNDEGFLTEYQEWDEEIAGVLAQQIGLDLTKRHWDVLHFLREDYQARGETATTRRVNTVGGISVKEQFALFPRKPGKKMSYVAGLPKPHGCV
jgi:TusE/DsrC/DsvC family sulfur relay protein